VWGSYHCVKILASDPRQLMSKMDLRETGYEDRWRMDPAQHTISQEALVLAEPNPRIQVQDS
jgi:hypothetical protein